MSSKFEEPSQLQNPGQNQPSNILEAYYTFHLDYPLLIPALYYLLIIQAPMRLRILVVFFYSFS